MYLAAEKIWLEKKQGDFMGDAKQMVPVAPSTPAPGEMIYRYQCDIWDAKDGLPECHATVLKYATTGALVDRYCCYGEEKPQSCFAAVRAEEGLAKACFTIVSTWPSVTLKWGGPMYTFAKVPCRTRIEDFEDEKPTQPE